MAVVIGEKQSKDKNPSISSSLKISPHKLSKQLQCLLVPKDSVLFIVIKELNILLSLFTTASIPASSDEFLGLILQATQELVWHSQVTVSTSPMFRYVPLSTAVT